MTEPQRPLLLRRGYRLAIFTVLWNVVEGVVAVAAGLRSGSVALLSFGVDSFLETASAVVVGWRLRQELSGGASERIEAIERRTAQIAGALLLGLAVFIAIHAGGRLLGHGERPRESLLGIGLTSLSLIVMPVVGRMKLRTATALGSGALRADAFETIACAWLSFTTLGGLLLNAVAGWWWADPGAALILVPLIAREGLEGLRGEACHDPEHDDVGA